MVKKASAMVKVANKPRRQGVKKRSSTTAKARIVGHTGASQLGGGEGRVDAVMKAAERSGLLKEKSGRIAGRVSPALVEQARKRTGIEADSDLLAFALANVALQDDFPEAFKKVNGKVDPELKLGF